MLLYERQSIKMSCLDINLCPGEKLYNVTCNFSTMYIDYECNSNTCMRVDGTYDCCAIHPYYCRQPLESLFRTPTIEPSRAINTKMCNKICGGKSKLYTCYWYEKRQTDNLCIENNKEYCCFENRTECCSTNQTYVYIVIGSIASIIVIFAYYLYNVKKSHKKIVPAKEASEICV